MLQSAEIAPLYAVKLALTGNEIQGILGNMGLSF
jgi:hypothetical protein